MRKQIYIRRFNEEDLPQILQLFYETVHEINKNDYSPAQLNAWAPKESDTERWRTSLSANYVVIVEVNGIIAGFGDLNQQGYLDRLFVHKNYQRQGIAGMIVEIIEARALRCDLETIYTEASITAKPFFESKGYTTMVEQHKAHNGQVFINYVMKKDL